MAFITPIQQEYNRVLESETEKYRLSYPIDCVKIDAQIIEIEVRITELTKKRIQGLSAFEKNTLDVLMQLRPQKKLEFFRYDCVNVFESKKLLETKNILDTEFLKTDTDVLPTTNKNKTILFFIGGTVILTALVIILRKTK